MKIVNNNKMIIKFIKNKYIIFLGHSKIMQQSCFNKNKSKISNKLFWYFYLLMVAKQYGLIMKKKINK